MAFIEQSLPTNVAELVKVWYQQQPKQLEPIQMQLIQHVLAHLNHGLLRVASPTEYGEWQTHEWVKQAVLLALYHMPMKYLSDGVHRFQDKWPLKWTDEHASDGINPSTRVVPGAVVRYGAYIGHKTVLMPCFINMGAYVGDETMIDTWATVGSCVQVGRRVHLSGGAGLGGVLEPIQHTPTIIEDEVFIGARSEIVEGVRIGKGSVIAMGTFIGQSTKIYNRHSQEISYGVVPPYSVVVPGSLPDRYGQAYLNCAVILKQVDAKTRAKTSINQLLRDAALGE